MIGALIRRLRAIVTRRRLDDDLADEIRLHLEMRTRSLVERGLDPRDAAAEARRQFGNVTLKREDAREHWSVRAVDGLVQDVRFGGRLMRRSPVFSAVAVLSLGVGMGASAAVFSLADAVLFRKLPVRAPDELVTLEWRSGPKPPTTSLSGNMTSNAQGFASTSFSKPGYERLRQTAAGTADLFAFGIFWGGVNFSADAGAEVVGAQAVSGSYYNVLGLVPAAGRLIGESDDRVGAPPVAVISHTFWQRRFGSSPEAIGKAIAINDVAVTIVGVAPPGFHGTLEAGDSPPLSVPISLRTALERGTDWTSAELWWLVIMGRLSPGATRHAALPSLDGAFAQVVAEQHPALTPAEMPRLHALPGSRGQTDARASRLEAIRIMAAVAGVLLLVASANVASLLLVRGAARSREIAMRLSIGASRGRIVRQFVTEAMLLSALGSALAVAVAEWIAQGLVATLAASAPGLDLAVSGRLVAFAAALGAICCALFGLLPALRATRPVADAAVMASIEGRAVVGNRRATALVNGLVLVQVALSVLLASLGGLLACSVWNLQRAAAGFDPTNVLIFTVAPQRNGYEPARIRSTYETAITRLEALPGVRSATFSGSTLISGGGSTTVAARLDTIAVRNTDAFRRLERENVAWRLVVGDRFFETMGIPLLRGRAFTAAEASGAAIPGVVINRALARKLFEREDVVGERFKTGINADAPVTEVIGVVADAKYADLRRDAPPTIYGSYRQHRLSNATFEIKTSGDPLVLAPLVVEAMGAVDPNLPLASLRTQVEQIQRSMSRERLLARLAVTLGVLSAALSAIGLYALLSYAVSRRVPEIGVRVALGAARPAIQWMVVRHAVAIAAVGALAGLAAASLASSLVRSLLFGLSPTDPVVLAGAAAINFSVALLAAYLPARRAAQVDPVVALRAG